MNRVLIFLLGILLLCSVAAATTIDLAPQEINSGINKEFNLTLNNHGDREAVTNISIFSEEFKITQGFGGEEWQVNQNENEVLWYNSSLGTSVVYALFPFRMTAPQVNADTEYNITITLYGPTRIQRVRLPVIARAKAAEKDLFVPQTIALKVGKENKVTFTTSSSGISNLSVQLLGTTYTPILSDNKFELTVLVPKGAALRDELVTIKGTVNGTLFSQTEHLSVIEPLTIKLEAPATLNTSETFLLKGKVETGNVTLTKKSIMILWQSQETKVVLDADHEFVAALIGPAEQGDFVVKAQLEKDNFVYTQSKTIKVSGLASEVPANDTKTVNATTRTTPTRTRATRNTDSLSTREGLSDVGLVDAPPKRSFRPYVAVLLILLMFALFVYAYKNISVPSFSSRKKPEEDEEKLKQVPRHKTIKWDDYWEKRRKELKEEKEGKQ